MFKNKIIRYSTVAMVLAILAYFFVENLSGIGNNADDSFNPEAYATKLLAERATKDSLFKTGEESPIPDKETFHGLHYFGANPEYRVKATFTPYTGDDRTFEVTYTDGTQDAYERYGYATFTINGSQQKLLLLKHEAALSLLFRDETSGKETYGGGRYLDFKMEDIVSNGLVIDFNKAYNPYCAYQENYACPIPPAENKLTISIFAGEQYEEAMH